MPSSPLNSVYGLSVGNPEIQIIDNLGNHNFPTLGTGLRIKTGVNATCGKVALVAGSKVVTNNLITANSVIFLTCQIPGGTPGFLRISASVVGTSFTIYSSSASDTSTVGWLIVELIP